MPSRRPRRMERRLPERRAEAEARNTAFAALTPIQKLNALNKKLGDGVGAEKQRARLQKKIDAETQAVIEAANKAAAEKAKAAETKASKKPKQKPKSNLYGSDPR